MQDTYKTKVIFRKFADDSIIALFPEMAGSERIESCMSYMHVGQHGSADLHWVIMTTSPATEAEYTDLREELESMGYNLQICYRESRAMGEKRRAQVQSIMQG